MGNGCVKRLVRFKRSKRPTRRNNRSSRLFSGRESTGNAKDVDRAKLVRERQNEERQRKLEELRQQAFAAQRFREQREEERRRRIDEIRSRDNDRFVLLIFSRPLSFSFLLPPSPWVIARYAVLRYNRAKHAFNDTWKFVETKWKRCSRKGRERLIRLKERERESCWIPFEIGLFNRGENG